MQYFSGLIPPDQQVLHSEPYPYVYRYAPLRRRSMRKGLLACLLLISAFFLLLWGSSMESSSFNTMSTQKMGTALEEEPIALVAPMVGYGPAEAAQLRWGIGRDSNKIVTIRENEGPAQVLVN